MKFSYNYFSPIWKYYIYLSRSDKPIKTKPNSYLKDKSPLNIFNNISVIIYSSNRNNNLKNIKKAVEKFNKYRYRKNLKNKFIILDVDKSFLNINSLKFLTIFFSIFFLPFLFPKLISSRSFSYFIFQAYCLKINLLKISSIHLFTSNNRLTELFRLASISCGISSTEYLHGICSDRFANYYDLLLKISQKEQIKYVNLSPYLPMPTSIKNNLLNINGKEVYFFNEKKWDSNISRNSIDIIIVGGNIAVGNYSASKFFLNEIKFMRKLSSTKLTMMYCPHPSFKNSLNLIPKNIRLGKLNDHINSSKFIIGHYSSILFTAFSLGKNVLIFEEGLSSIPDYFFKDFFPKHSCILNSYLLEDLYRKGLSVLPTSSNFSKISKGINILDLEIN